MRTFGGLDTLYFINEGVWRIPVNADLLPSQPFIRQRRGEAQDNRFYALGVHPETSKVYVADAIDYLQNGIVYRFSRECAVLDSVIAGIIPGSFYFASP